MSKIYEALRQKEQESSASRTRDTAGSAEIAESLSLQPELDGTDEVLLAAVAAAGDEPQLGADFAPQFELTPEMPASEPDTSPSGFRRLKLPYKEESRLLFQTDPDGLAAEQFRFMRRTLEQKFPKGAVLLITSPATKYGKTLTALNLASCLADNGRSTLLLEADIRQPGLHKILRVPDPSPGIEAVLAGTADPSQVVWFVETLSLCVAMVVEPPADPFRLVCGPGFQHFLAWAREGFEWVVIDSPPVLPAADVTQLATMADAVLLVVRAQSTPRELATRSFELLGSHLSGIILIEATNETNPYYRYLAEYRQKTTLSLRPDSSSRVEKKTS